MPHTAHRRYRRVTSPTGKAAVAMAAAAADVLRPSDAPLPGLAVRGLVITKHGHVDRTLPADWQVIEAGHPTPDEASLRAGAAALSLASAADARTLTLLLLSGGASALMTQPQLGMSLHDMAGLTAALLASGATIHEMNTVRKHVDRVKGGGLAAAAAGGYAVHTLALSDIIGNAPDAIGSGPGVPDPSTLAHVREVMDTYSLWGQLPTALAGALDTDGPAGCTLPETPSNPAEMGFSAADRLHCTIVGSNLQSLRAVEAAARSAGFTPLLLTTRMEGEAQGVAANMVGMALDTVQYAIPVSPPCAIIAGGEATVSIPAGCTGSGGRNQEMAVAAAIALHNSTLELRDMPVSFVALGTDGTDGPNDAAGGCVDRGTAAAAQSAGVDLHSLLRAHDSYHAMAALPAGHHIMTGPTGTNVMDVYAVFVGEPKPCD